MSDMKLTDLPQEAVDAFNKHKHNEDGKRIPTDGIEDLAITNAKLAPKIVTTDKMADSAITGDKVLNGSLGAEKFKPGVLATVDMTSANVGFKNYIANGLNLDWNGGLNLIVRKGRANINDVFVDLQNDITLPIPANSHGLGYLNKDGALGFAPFKYPTIDSDFICAYNFSDIDPKTKVTDLTGNGYDLVGDGTLTDIISEPGHIGQGCSTGVNSGLKSTKTVNIPSASAGTLIYAFIEKDDNITKIPFCVGDVNPLYHYIFTDNTLYPSWQPVIGEITTGARTVKNKMNVLISDYDGYYVRFFLNGRLIVKIKATYTGTAAITGNIFVGEYFNAGYRGTKRSIHCFAGLTKKIYTQEEISDMCVAMGVANQYEAPAATVPSFVGEIAENHIWNMDETTGNTIADTGTKFANALQGTAVNVNIGKSEIGLGIKRKFNGTTSKIILGNYAFQPEYSMFAVVEVRSVAMNGMTLLGNYAASPQRGNMLAINGSGYLQAWTGNVANWTTGSRKLPLNKIAIVGYIVDSSGITFYADSAHGDKILGYKPDINISQPTSIGECGNGQVGQFFDGDIHHMFLINRKLTQLEIKQLFNNIKNKTLKEMKDVVLPADSISLGCVKSDTGKLVDISTLPKYGVCSEPFLRGNKFFTGFRYVSIDQTIEMENPFGTTRVNVTAYRKQFPWSDVIMKTDNFTYYSSSNLARGAILQGCTNDTLIIRLGSNALALNTADYNADNSYGWIGFIVEKIDSAITDGNDLNMQVDI